MGFVLRLLRLSKLRNGLPRSPTTESSVSGLEDLAGDSPIPVAAPAKPRPRNPHQSWSQSWGRYSLFRAHTPRPLTVEVTRVGHHSGELFELVQGGLHPLAFYWGRRHGQGYTAEEVAGAR